MSTVEFAARGWSLTNSSPLASFLTSARALVYFASFDWLSWRCCSRKWRALFCPRTSSAWSSKSKRGASERIIRLTCSQNRYLSSKRRLNWLSPHFMWFFADNACRPCRWTVYWKESLILAAQLLPAWLTYSCLSSWKLAWSEQSLRANRWPRACHSWTKEVS